MAEIGTFSKFKDWLLLALVGGVLSLVGVLHTTATHRIDLLEAKAEVWGDRVDSHAGRLATIEAQLASQRDETFRRLDRIERKLDDLLPIRTVAP